MTAASAERNTVMLAASFTRLSPSSTVFTFLGVLKNFRTELAATASGGDMIPPSRSPIDKVNLGTSFSETNATMTDVTITSPNPCNPIGQRIFQKLGQDVNQAASYSRGGRKIRKIKSGLMPERRAPVIRLISSPLITRNTG